MITARLCEEGELTVSDGVVGEKSYQALKAGFKTIELDEKSASHSEIEEYVPRVGLRGYQSFAPHIPIFISGGAPEGPQRAPRPGQAVWSQLQRSGEMLSSFCVPPGGCK
jgi:hypothetical protein